MADHATALVPEKKGSALDGISGMFNAFIDPAATARNMRSPWAWIFPFLAICIATTFITLAMIPITLNVMRMNPPNGATGEQLNRILSVTGTIMHGTAYGSPIMIGIFLAIFAALILAMCSIFSIKTKFRDVFSVLCACGMITLLQAVAGYLVIRAKGADIQSMQQLKPSFGLDIFFADLKGPGFALLNFFSIFEIWYIIMLGLVFAYMVRTKKSQAFLATSPAWIVPLLLSVVGAMFQRG